MDAIKGGAVCRMHGGSAPQVREAARLRLLELVDPALATIARAVKQKRTGPVELKAAHDILDRTGLAAPKEEMIQAGVTINVNVYRAGYQPESPKELE